MLRFIGGVVVGYVVMAVCVIVTFTGVYLLLGADGAFQPGSYDVTLSWVVASFVLGIAAALLGGWVCFRIARNRNAVLTLAGIVVVLGLLVAIPALASEDTRPNVRPGDVASFEAMQQARQPAWIALVNPLVGAAGILIGGGWRRR
jgi:hypothetical protein